MAYDPITFKQDLYTLTIMYRDKLIILKNLEFTKEGKYDFAHVDSVYDINDEKSADIRLKDLQAAGVNCVKYICTKDNFKKLCNTRPYGRPEEGSTMVILNDNTRMSIKEIVLKYYSKAVILKDIWEEDNRMSSAIVDSVFDIEDTGFNDRSRELREAGLDVLYLKCLAY